MSSEHMDIAVPYSQAAAGHLHLRVGACKIAIRPGGSQWVTGTYIDPTTSLPCRVTQDGDSVRITQEPRLGGITGWSRGTPSFDLSFGTAQPYSLTLETGASDAEIDLGGVPLTRLDLKLGAGRHVIRFLEPNPQPLDLFTVNAGAGALELRNLANANFAEMTLDGGAATFICDFGGTLRRDGMVRLSAGMTTVDLQVPATTPARISADVTLGRITADDFTLRSGDYVTPAGLEPRSPYLTIKAGVALGMLHLRLADTAQ